MNAIGQRRVKRLDRSIGKHALFMMREPAVIVRRPSLYADPA
jgi:hypothetical protein